MPTDETINADLDQDQIDTTDHVDDSDENFNARKASRTFNEKLTRLEKKYEAEIAALKAKLEPEEVIETPQEDDLETKILKRTEELVNRKEWYASNQARIANLSEENKAIFEEKSKVMSLEDALTIAIAREPFKETTKENLFPTRSASLKRESASYLTEEEKAVARELGISESAMEKQKRLKEERAKFNL